MGYSKRRQGELHSRKSGRKSSGWLMVFLVALVLFSIRTLFVDWRGENSDDEVEERPHRIKTVERKRKSTVGWRLAIRRRASSTDCRV